MPPNPTKLIYQMSLAHTHTHTHTHTHIYIYDKGKKLQLKCRWAAFKLAVLSISQKSHIYRKNVLKDKEIAKCYNLLKKVTVISWYKTFIQSGGCQKRIVQPFIDKITIVERVLLFHLHNSRTGTSSSSKTQKANYNTNE